MTTSESAVWQRLTALVAAREYNALSLAVDELDAADRRTVAAALWADAQRQSTGGPFRSWEDGPLLAIIGAGVLPDAKSVATWLTRNPLSYHVPGQSQWELSEQKNVVPQVLFVLTRRGADWLPAVTTELAGRLRKDPAYHRFPDNYELVSRLLTATGQPLPVNDGFVVAWAVSQSSGDGVLAALKADPRLAALVPRLFELDEVGANLGRDGFWPATLAETVALGLVGRDVVLDACVARLGRKGRPGADRVYCSVLRALDPTLEEISARIPGYLVMLKAPSTVVAELAQQSMFQLDDAGALGSADLLASTRAILQRSEKKLVRAQLARISRAAGDRVELLAELVVDQLAHVTPDLSRAALVVLLDLSAAIPADRRSTLRDRAGALPQDLAAELSRVLDLDQSAPGRPSPAQPLLTAVISAPGDKVPIDPITLLDELTAETALLADWSLRADPLRLERVLEGLMSWARTDPDALHLALRPITSTDSFRALRADEELGYGLLRGIAAVIDAAAGTTPAVQVSDGAAAGGSAGAAVVKRLSVVAERLHRQIPGYPVSRPTALSGMVDPDTLLERLAQAAKVDVEPWDIELEQALLRLGPFPDATRTRLADQFHALGTAAGRTAATWVSLRLPTTPSMRTVTVPQYHTDYTGAVTRQWEKVMVAVHPAGPTEPTSVIWSALTNLDPTGTARHADHEGAFLFIPWLAPGHRDLIAAHLLGGNAEFWQAGGIVTAPMLPALADLDGPFGEATALALVYGWAADRGDARELATQATLTMCSRQVLDAAVLGRVFGDLAARRSVVLSRIPEPLRQAAESGAVQQVWEVLRYALPALLRAHPAPSGLGEVLALGVWCAERVRASEVVEGLADFASRRGSSLQLVEARRLHKLLVG